MSSDAVKAAFADFLAAMQAGDTQRLGRLIGSGFTLTHITGYVQPVPEWLAEMQHGQFIYHKITLTALQVDVTADTATLVARTRTDARVYGGRSTWPLQLTLDYARQEGRWIVLRAVATVWS